MADRKKTEINQAQRSEDGGEHGMHKGRLVVETSNRRPFSTNVREVESRSKNPYSRDIEVVFGPEVLKDNHPKTPKELCALLVSEKSFLENVLDHPEIFKGKFHSIWFLIADCCQCEEDKDLLVILKVVNDAEEFINNGLLKFLVKVKNGGSQEEVRTLCNVTIFLEKLFEHYSTLSFNLSSLKLILQFLQDSVKSNSTLLGEDLLCRLEQLEASIMNSKGRPGKHLDWSNIEDTKDNFRNQPVLPEMNEICLACESTLFSQAMVGKYRDVEQYLSNQFHLIRSELFRLISKTISLSKDYIEKGDDERLHEINCHKNVRITNILVSGDGVLHEVKFPRDSFLNCIPWEYSKHFTAGSLLCFSSDNFRTVVFASIVGHDPMLLDQQKLYVRFLPEALLGVYSNDKTIYAVTEIDVHFDVCTGILSNLQKMANGFPFEKYIVNLKTQIEPPLYAVDKSLKYCFDTVLSSNSEAEIPSSDPCSCAGEKVEIHNLVHCTDLDLGLDDSQKFALKTALTQSVTLIQGSPGTGKTRIALKLTKILLHNRQFWGKPNVCGPIVILTYSNSCLDTFLEGILETTPKVIRIGGKTKSSLLANNNLKRQTSLGDTLFQTKAKRELGVKLKKLSQHISDIESMKRKSKCALLSVEELGKTIAHNDLERLRENCSSDLSSADMDTLLRLWLDFESLRQATLGESQGSTFKDDSRTTGKKGTISEREIESLKHVQDAIFIHDERGVEGEFQDLTAVFPNDAYDMQLRQSAHDKSLNSGQRVIENICQKLNVVPMTAAQSAFCTDVWNLSLVNRWGLYLFWVCKCNEKYDAEIEGFRQEFVELLSELKALTESRQMDALSDAEIVGLTVTGAATYGGLVKRLKPKIIIVEEAEKISDSQILLLLSEETEHLILLGDQKSSASIESLFSSPDTSPMIPSLFQRLYESGFPICWLNKLYNLRPCVSQQLLSDNFGELAVNARVLQDENVKGLQKNVFFLSHSVMEVTSKDGTCHINDYEVNFIVELCRYILLQGYSRSSITILTPYLAQFYKLQKRMVGNLHGVKVSVSDNFQEESDIILVSFVRGETELANKTLREDRLLYTALTRAKHGLYFVGNFEAIAKRSNFWKVLCEGLIVKARFGPELNILCQAHGNTVSVKSLSGLVRLGDGGCGEPCKYRMPCGHECPRRCHPNDRDHKSTKCMEPCQASPCNNNHKCHKLCWEKCGNCTEMLDNVILRCGHSIQATCFRLTSDQHFYWKVPYKVKNSLYEQKDVKLAFAVKLSVENNGGVCFPSLEQECEVPCGKALQCGHQCKGKCGECMGERIHVPCLEVCGKMQLCGHQCLYPCSSPCPPCSFQYENRCSHKRFTVFCGFPATPCLKPCEWSCEHLTCSRLCHEPCDRPPCNEPCKKTLECGHNCIGMCGELCPNMCRICHSEEVTSLYFGIEEDPRARFIQLVDCGHIFEINGLTYWITKENGMNSASRLIKCPKCNKPILKSHRFGNLIKYQTRVIEVLKGKKYEMMSNVSEVKCMLSVVKKQLNMLIERNMAYERFWAEQQSCTDPCSILETLYARLLIKYNPIDQGTFTLFYNYYTFVLENYKIASKLEKLQDMVCLPLIGSAAQRTCDFTASTLEAVNERIVYFWEIGSPQFVEAIACELRRLNLACNFVIVCQSLFGFDNEYTQAKLGEALSLLLQGFPFRKHEEWLFSLILEEIHSVFPDIPVLEITSEPPIPVMEAMDLREGKSLWSRLEIDCDTSIDIKGNLEENLEFLNVSID